MIAVDANVLVYAHRTGAPFHAEASSAMTALAAGYTNWALPWPCLHEFYAVVTNPRLFSTPSTPSEAIRQIAAWLAAPTVRVIAEAPSHFTVLKQLLTAGMATGQAVHDAKIAAICLSHGVAELLTMDRNFSRYPPLRTRSLLA
ncbi:MAG TPA: TA system VapC family ribonuclease toxin [Jatrophihabitans sp.]|nr:TA system VapC family ribonuclease toxin [Jatrophihabitans sp.]